MECQQLLTALLDESAIAWERSGVWTRFRLREDGMVWECACRCINGSALLYSRYPMTIEQRVPFMEACETINVELPRGAMLVADGIPTFRLCADLEDAYGARERLAQTIEYSAAVIVRYWGRMQAVCRCI